MSSETREDKRAIWLIFRKLFKESFPCTFCYIEKQEKEKMKVRRSVEAGETFGSVLADSCNRALANVVDDELRDEIALEAELLADLQNRETAFSSFYNALMYITLNANFYKEGDDGYVLPIEINEKGEFEVGEISEIGI